MQLIFVVVAFVGGGGLIWFVLKVMDYFFYGQQSTQAAVWLVFVALNSHFLQGRTSQQKVKKKCETWHQKVYKQGLSCKQGVPMSKH